MNPVRALESAFLLGSAAAYAGGTAAASAALRWGSRRFVLWSRAASLFGIVLALSALVASAGRGRPLPAGTTAQALALLSAAASAVALTVDLRRGMPLLPAATLPVALLSSILALALTAIPPAPSPPNLGWKMILHIAGALAAYTAFAMAFAGGLLYLAVQRQLKRHTAPPFLGLMPALETVSSFLSRAIAAGVVLLAAGFLAGCLAAREIYPGHRQWRLDPKVLLTTVTLLIYGTILILSRYPAFKGRRTALACVAGFALVLATLGANILGSGFHRF